MGISYLTGNTLHFSEATPPIVTFDQGRVSLSSRTQGASLSYKIILNDDESMSWQIYTKPFAVPDASIVKIQAHRIGFDPSEIVEWLNH